MKSIWYEHGYKDHQIKVQMKGPWHFDILFKSVMGSSMVRTNVPIGRVLYILHVLGVFI